MTTMTVGVNMLFHLTTMTVSCQQIDPDCVINTKSLIDLHCVINTKSLIDLHCVINTKSLIDIHCVIN